MLHSLTGCHCYNCSSYSCGVFSNAILRLYAGCVTLCIYWQSLAGCGMSSEACVSCGCAYQKQIWPVHQPEQGFCMAPTPFWLTVRSRSSAEKLHTMVYAPKLDNAFLNGGPVLWFAGGKITSCTACEDGQSIASGSSNGSVHLWRVEFVTRSGGMPDKYTGLQSMSFAPQTVIMSCLCLAFPS